MPHLHLLFLLILAAAAVLFEDEWIRTRLWNGNTAKLPHRTVLTIRWGALAIWVLLWFHGPWVRLFTFILMAALLGSLHAIGLNLRRHKPWYYLGPFKRTRADSAIDTIFIALASPPAKPVLGGEVYAPKPVWLPMVLAVAVDLLIALAAHGLLMQL